MEVIYEIEDAIGFLLNETSHAYKDPDRGYDTLESQNSWLREFTIGNTYNCYYNAEETNKVFMELNSATGYIVGVSIAGGCLIFAVVMMIVAQP
jgi:hypothetical protein